MGKHDQVYYEKVKNLTLLRLLLLKQSRLKRAIAKILNYRSPYILSTSEAIELQLLYTNVDAWN
jgi:hypothetical protein